VAMIERTARQQFLFGRLLLVSRHDVMEGNQIISVVGFHLKFMGHTPLEKWRRVGRESRCKAAGNTRCYALYDTIWYNKIWYIFATVGLPPGDSVR